MFLDINIKYTILEGEIISIKNKALILSIVLILFVTISAVSAVNETDVDDSQEVSDSAEEVSEVSQDSDVSEVLTAGKTDVAAAENEGSDESAGDELAGNQTTVETTIKSSNKNVIQGKTFTVTLTDSNSTPLANKTVKIKIGTNVTKVTTDKNGNAKIIISNDPGTYTVKYSFSQTGYTTCKNSTKILVISTSKSKVKASYIEPYVGFTNKFTVCLTVGGIPLAGREVTFKINGKTITKKTNSKGQASINIDESKGTYTVYYSYAGEQNIKPVNGSTKIKVKNGMPTKIKRANSVVYYNQKAGYLKVKLYNERGSLLKSRPVTFKVNGKTYTKKTNSKGIASVKIKLNKGTYKVKVSFKKTAHYKGTSKTITIKVKKRPTSNDGMWLFASDMKKVKFSTLKKYSLKHIFLNFVCVEKFGKSYVQSWIKKASKYGLKVHIWMQVFYNGGWINPVKNGKVNYNLINKKVSAAKKYAKIKGVSGVHFDYLRYPGTAYKYKNSVKAVNTFTKKASEAIHKVNKKLIVSAAIMPEPSGMKYYYGQDVPTLSKYLDALVPMVYKGNYNAGSSWIKSVTKTFVKQSNGAQVWTGLQGYKSDSYVKKLSTGELKNDATAAANGGATGVIVFRYTLFNFIDFAGV